MHPDSRAVAARAQLSALWMGRRRHPPMTSGPCCQRAADCKWPLLNVTKGAICIQLPRWQRESGKSHGRTASRQMCPKPACVSDGINVYVPVHMPSILLQETTKQYILLVVVVMLVFTRLNRTPNLQYVGSQKHSLTPRRDWE